MCAWLAPKLNKRVQILKPFQDPNNEGGFDFDINGDGVNPSPLATVWMGFSPIGKSRYIRGKQVNEVVTHEFIVRYLTVKSLGKEFRGSFNLGFKSMPDLGPLKPDYYLFFQSNSSAVKGRLFRIDSIINVGENNEYLSIAAEEIEERGTGYPA